MPGLLLKRIHGKSGYEVWLQGLDSNRVLVVLNGEPITPSTGSTVDLSQIGATDIERIEIVKGATSALYGSSAMGGVINVITRRPTRPLAWSLGADAGSYGDKNLSGEATDLTARHLSGNFSLKRSHVYLQLNGDVREFDGFDLNPASYATEGDEGVKANLDLRLGWIPNAHTEIYLAPRYYTEDLSTRFSTFAPGVGDIRKVKREDAERRHTTLGAERRFNDGGRLRGWLVSDHWRDRTRQDVIATPVVEQQRDAAIDLYRAELQWDRPWGDSRLFTSGLVVGHERLMQDKTENGQRVEEVSGKTTHSVEAYLQDDIFLPGRWELVPGLRLQDDSDFGFYAAPKLNALYTPAWFDDLTTHIRVGYGRGYRVPNLKERFYVFDHSGLGYMVLGNRGLVPESADSFQAGIEFARPGIFHADINLFHNRIRDIIDTDLNPAKTAAQGLQIFEYRNIGRALTQGVELAANYRVDARLGLRGSYTLLDSEDRTTGKTLTQRPRHQIKAGMDYARADWGTTFTLRGIYQSEEFVDSQNRIESPAWMTWDVKVTQAISRGVTIYAGIDNLGNVHRAPDGETDFRPEEGRFIYLGARFDG